MGTVEPGEEKRVTLTGPSASSLILSDNTRFRRLNFVSSWPSRSITIFHQKIAMTLHVRFVGFRVNNLASWWLVASASPCGDYTAHFVICSRALLIWKWIRGSGSVERSEYFGRVNSALAMRSRVVFNRILHLFLSLKFQDFLYSSPYESDPVHESFHPLWEGIGILFGDRVGYWVADSCFWLANIYSDEAPI